MEEASDQEDVCAGPLLLDAEEQPDRRVSRRHVQRQAAVCAIGFSLLGLIMLLFGRASSPGRGQVSAWDSLPLLGVFSLGIAHTQPNPPVWPASVKVFGPETPSAEISAAVGAAFNKNGGHEPDFNGEFSEERFAFLFKPGKYTVDVPVGYYTQVLGLGSSPRDVVFTSSKGVYSEEGSFDYKKGALNNFWRSAENFVNAASYTWLSSEPGPLGMVLKFGPSRGMLWAVSQAAPIRRIIVTENLILSQATVGPDSTPPPGIRGGRYGRSSGGFMANIKVYGHVMVGSQQQWITRNSDIQKWSNGNYNMVFVGVDGAPSGLCGDRLLPYISVDTAPVIAEKPFISIDDQGKYHLNIPRARWNRRGTDFANEDVSIVGFEMVYVADSTRDTAATINAQLDGGLHVVLVPGIYSLDAPLRLSRENQVLLGLGMATLKATSGNALLYVMGRAHGVRIGGVLLEAGPLPSEVLLEWGDGSDAGNASNPSFLFDVFARVGGASPAQQAHTMLRIRSGHVVGDNVWLWRADHGANGFVTTGGSNPCQVGAQIFADDVTMYGLFSEHSLTDQVQWSGQRGVVYLLQTELPYDATSAYGVAGYAGLRVNETVQSFSAYGVGVYHFFRDSPVHLRTTIVAPPALEPFFVSPIAVRLTGLGTVDHVLNDKGVITAPHTAPWAYVCPPLAGSALAAQVSGW